MLPLLMQLRKDTVVLDDDYESRGVESEMSRIAYRLLIPSRFAFLVIFISFMLLFIIAKVQTLFVCLFIRNKLGVEIDRRARKKCQLPLM